MLSGKGFSSVINVAGGIKAWDGQKALGDEQLGIGVFAGADNPEEALKVAYSLEQGLRDFYLSMKKTVLNQKVLALFDKLAEIETVHQKHVFDQYVQVSGETMTQEAFEKSVEAAALEGGLTTREYLDIFKPDMENPRDVVSLAMSIEGQAMDMYLRVAEKAENEKTKAALVQIAREEQTHLAQLGNLMESI